MYTFDDAIQSRMYLCISTLYVDTIWITVTILFLPFYFTVLLPFICTVLDHTEKITSDTADAHYGVYRCISSKQYWVYSLSPCINLNPFLPTVPTFAERETDDSRHNGGTSGAPLKPLRDESALPTVLNKMKN